MKTKHIIYTLLVLALGYLIYNRITAKPAGNQARGNRNSGDGKKNGPMTVNGIIIKPEVFTDHLNITGSIEANEEIQVRGEISGLITGIYFKEGSNVSKGSLLIKVNDNELQAQLAKAITQQKLAEEKEYRQRILLQKDAVSKQDYDAILAELNSLKSETQLFRAQLQKTEIRAPFNGTIGLRSISMGDYITPQTVIANLVNTNPAKITFAVPEKYVQVLRKNSSLSFTVEGSNKVHTANVFAIEPKIDESTRTVMLKAKASNADGSLLAGSFARIELPLKETTNAIFVPSQAIVPVLKGKKVFINKNGTAQEVMVETGARTDATVQVLKGLNTGDTVLTTGIMSLKADAPIKVKISN
ncbi:efflux RND transporter periplasmic adaptor subunit [Solitalea koreensis]|uniref:Membrane fusion protein, multidrug efflux system n=1 Tax=Solitalea koreensis TaxID=543615 RepID=A0A521AMC9_9SPHI|nr:efflux RND transporter periplasmic adaptor subunit [Solitalea koreensis]SMO35921.1 membrane fusion protein, multidrug efflux system [Solitalea koreensis]